MATLPAEADEVLASLTADDLLAELGKLADKIDADNAQAKLNYEMRRAMFAEGRRRTPPIGTRILGEAARVSDVAVSNTVNKPKKPRSD